MSERMGRRGMLRRTVHLTVLASAAPMLLSACGGGELECSDVSSLSAGDRTARAGAQYVDRATDASRRCDGCSFYQAGAAGQCGACTVVRGPINPSGSCQLWAARS